VNTILVVCVGNICRSPVAEGLLKAQLPEKTIWSAGLGALVGHAADPLAQEIAAAHGVDISGHRAQQITSWLCTQADLILVMETAHKRELESLYPFARGKVRCLGDTGNDALFEVADPYRQGRSAFETAHAAIERGVAHWAGLLRRIG
jgi:protein-tyrosine phosphatase